MVRAKKKIIYRPSRRRPVYKRRWFWDLVLLFFFILGSGLFFLKASYFNIEKIEVNSQEKFKKRIIEIASSQKNFFLFNKNAVSKEIKKEFPEVQEVIINKKFPNLVYIEIKERKMFGIFCQEEIKNCFLMSEDGVIYKRRINEEGILFLSKEKSQLKEGDQVLKKEIIEGIIYLKEELKVLKIEIKEIEISAFEINIFTNKGFKIFFYQENFPEAVKTFIYVFKKEIPDKEKEKLEYIDLRLLENGKKGPIYWK